MMTNFSWMQRRHFLMLCCRQVIVLVSPWWLWERCLCLLGAIYTRIKSYWMSSFYLWKKVYDCKFFVLWCSPLHRFNVWRSCSFLQWLHIQRFCIGIFLVGGMFLTLQLNWLEGCVVLLMDAIFYCFFYFIWDVLFVQLYLTLMLFLLYILARGLFWGSAW